MKKLSRPQQGKHVLKSSGAIITRLLLVAIFLVLAKVFYVGILFNGENPIKIPNILNSSVEAQVKDTSSGAGGETLSDNASEYDIKEDFTWSYELILALQKRDAELRVKKDALQKEEERIGTLKKQIDARIEKLTQLEKRIASLIEQKKAVENEKVKKLAKVFEETPPEQAGPLMSKLDVDIAAQLILKMTGRKAGRIWGYVDPDQAVRISKELARLKPGFDINKMSQGK